VEAILPWTGVMKRGIVFEGLLRFMDQQRRNNFYFFENCTANRKRGSSAFIPFENLGTLELAGMTGNVGKEIYGAGECIWMYLMFEALGHSSDRELMLVNLDLLDVIDAKEFSQRKLNFILYNPTLATRSAKITIPAADGRAVRLTADGRPSPKRWRFKSNPSSDCKPRFDGQCNDPCPLEEFVRRVYLLRKEVS